MVDQTRRWFTASVATLPLATSGCITASRNERVRRWIAIESVEVLATDPEWELRVAVYNVDLTWGNKNIRGARLIGYGIDDLDQVCETDIGYLPVENNEDNPLEVTLHCSQAPELFTFETDHSICDGEIIPYVYVFDIKQEVFDVITTCRRQCGDPLPPDLQRSCPSDELERIRDYYPSV